MRAFETITIKRNIPSTLICSCCLHITDAKSSPINFNRFLSCCTFKNSIFPENTTRIVCFLRVEGLQNLPIFILRIFNICSLLLVLPIRTWRSWKLYKTTEFRRCRSCKRYDILRIKTFVHKIPCCVRKLFCFTPFNTSDIIPYQMYVGNK